MSLTRPRGTLLPTVETGSITLQGSAAYVEAMRKRLGAVAVIIHAGRTRRCGETAQYTQQLEISLGPKPGRKA